MRDGRLLVQADWLLAPGGTLREHGAVLIEGGRIAALLGEAEADAVTGAERLVERDAVVLPGLVNAHQHGRPDPLPQLGVPDAPLERWLASLLALPPQDVAVNTRRLAGALALTGTTTALHAHTTTASTAEAYEAELRALLAAYREAGVRGVVAADVRDRGIPVHGDPAPFLAGLPKPLRQRVRRAFPAPPAPEQALEIIADLHSEIRAGRHGDVDLMLGPPGPPWCSASLYGRLAQVAAEQGLAMQTHLLESRLELEFGRRDLPEGTLLALDRLGVLGERFSAAHGVWLDSADRRRLAAAGSSVVTNPGSNLRLHAGVAPVRELLAAGVNVALGTDNMALADDEDLFGELRLLRALQRRPSLDDEPVSARTLLTLATEAGGRALGRPDVGVLRPGARGDAVVVGLARLRRPGTALDPFELLVAGAGAVDVRTVVAGGQVLVRNGAARRPSPEPAPPTVEGDAELAAALEPYIREHYRGYEN